MQNSEQRILQMHPEQAVEDMIADIKGALELRREIRWLRWKKNRHVSSLRRCWQPDIYSMWIQTKVAKNAKPGQFISMYTNDAGKLLPRPISICEIDRESEKLRVVYRVTGENTGTEQFSKLQAGDTIDIVGPLGNGFPLEKAKGKKVFLMGGGIGIPPMLAACKGVGM